MRAAADGAQPVALSPAVPPCLPLWCRWMAPEVIEHNPYKEKADVFRCVCVWWVCQVECWMGAGHDNGWLALNIVPSHSPAASLATNAAWAPLLPLAALASCCGSC